MPGNRGRTRSLFRPVCCCDRRPCCTTWGETWWRSSMPAASNCGSRRPRVAWGWRPGLESPFQHLFTQHRLGRKIELFGDAGGTAARTILYPIMGKIQLTVQQNRTPFAGITKEHSYLTVLDPSRSSAVLPLDPRRMDALLQESSLVQNQYCIWIP